MMGKYNYSFSIYESNDTTSIEKLREEDKLLIDSFKINSSFNQLTDFIDVHFYSLDGRLLATKQNSTNIQTNPDSETANRGTLNTVTLRVEEDLLQQGFEYGDVYLSYNFLRNSYQNNQKRYDFFIEEISSDRYEIRLLSRDLPDELLIELTAKLKASINNPDTSDFYLNFGENRLLLITNVDTLKYKDFESVVVRLYTPLPEDIATKTTLTINEKVSDTITFQAFAELVEDEIKVPYLKGPNFSIEIEDSTEQPTEYFSINELFGYPVTNSYYEVRSAFEEKGAQISIDYSNYSNFINFSSAEERLANFKYKVELISSYQTLSNSAANANNNQAGVSGSTEYYQGLITNILSNFDHYDRFLYYESSSFAWPKVGTKKPYTLATGATADSWYELQLASASTYDSSNVYSLENTIPEFLRDDPDNIKYLTFVHMIGQHFDNLWIYTKSVSEKYNADNRLDFGVSKDLIQDALKNFGVKLYSSNKSTQELFKIFTGDFYSLTSDEFGSRLNDATFITGSNLAISEEDYRKEIYKRLYHNLPLLNKAKGTERGIRALVSSFGVPSLYTSGSFNGITLNQIGGTISGSFNLGGDQYVTSSFERIRIDNTGSIVSGNTLSPYTSIVKTDSKYSKDYNLIELGFSPANYINNLIIASSSADGFNIDSIIGDPRLEQESSYEDLKTKAGEYLTPISSSVYDLRDFVRLLKFYDNVLFKTATDFLPARANTSTGIIIKPHLLERSKAKAPSLSNSLHHYSGSIQIGEVSGSHGGSFRNKLSELDTSYSHSVMTPFGPGLLPYHTHNEAKYDGEFSGSKIVLSTGELNDENEFKYENPNSSIFKVFIERNCDFDIIIEDENSFIGPTPTNTPLSATPTSTPTPTDTPLNATPTVTPTNTPLGATPTSTPTPTDTPLGATPTSTPLIYYRFEKCDETQELVFQTLSSEPSTNDRYTDGIDNYIYDGTSTTLPGTVVTNLSGPIGTGCVDPTPTPTPTDQQATAEVRACAGGPSLYYTFSNYSSLPDVTPNAAIEISGTCYEILTANYTGPLNDGTVTGGQIYPSGCSSCLPTPTATPTPTNTPELFSYIAERNDGGDTAYVGPYSQAYSPGDEVWIQGDSSGYCWTLGTATTASPTLTIDALCLAPTPTATPTDTPLICNNTTLGVSTVSADELCTAPLNKTVYYTSNDAQFGGPNTVIYGALPSPCDTQRSTPTWYTNGASYWYWNGASLTELTGQDLPNCG